MKYVQRPDPVPTFDAVCFDPRVMPDIAGMGPMLDLLLFGDVTRLNHIAVVHAQRLDGQKREDGVGFAWSNVKTSDEPFDGSDLALRLGSAFTAVPDSHLLILRDQWVVRDQAGQYSVMDNDLFHRTYQRSEQGARALTALDILDGPAPPATFRP